MKKLFILSIIFCIVISCKEKDKTISVVDIVLNSSADTLAIGETLTLIATIYPNDATDQTIVWKSSDTNKAIVNNGVVIALNLGSTIITAITQSNDKKATNDLLVSNTKYYGCNKLTPGFGENLGTIAFATDSTWSIIGNGHVQIWSDAITATNCQKTTFDGGMKNNLNADCRSNSGFRGDLFSWCVVYRFADQLCPSPWRVPTVQDFINLDIAMGGNGLHRQWLEFVDNCIVNCIDKEAEITFLNNTYFSLNVWGGELNQNTETAFPHVNYWALDGRLIIWPTSGINTLGANDDSFYGFSNYAIRCVK